MGSSLAPLRDSAYRRLATSYALNELGDWLGAVALAILVFDETGSPLATSGLFIASKFLPAFVAPALTARVDQLATNRALPILYVGEAAAFFVLAATADAFLLPLVLALALVDGTLALAGRALTRAAVALTLEPAGQLRQGNALLNIAFAVAGTGGPALAGLVVAAGGVPFALALDGGGFLLMAVVIFGARGLPHAQPDREPWRQRIRAGLGYVRRHRFVRALIAGQSLAFVFFSAIVPLEVVYAKEVLDAGNGGFGALLASWGGGMVLGSLAFTAARQGSTVLLIALSTGAVGAAYLGMAAVDSLLAACVLSVLGGTGNGIQWVSVVTAMQEATRAEYQARVVALLESAGAAMPGIGFLLGGVLAATVSTRAAYVVAGVGALLVTVVLVVVLRGSLPAGGEGAAEPPSAG